MSEDDVVRRLAHVFYVSYCRQKGTRPAKNGYLPPWALDYAILAVEALGFDDSADRAMARMVQEMQAA